MIIYEIIGGLVVVVLLTVGLFRVIDHVFGRREEKTDADAKGHDAAGEGE